MIPSKELLQAVYPDIDIERTEKHEFSDDIIYVDKEGNKERKDICRVAYDCKVWAFDTYGYSFRSQPLYGEWNCQIEILFGYWKCINEFQGVTEYHSIIKSAEWALNDLQ